MPRFVEQQLWSGESTRIAGNQRNLVASAAGHIERGVWGPGRWGVIGAAGRDRRTRIGPDWGARRATRAGSAVLTPQLFVTSFCVLEGRKMSSFRQITTFSATFRPDNSLSRGPPTFRDRDSAPSRAPVRGVPSYPCTGFIYSMCRFATEMRGEIEQQMRLFSRSTLSLKVFLGV